jgi:hypothetical protein
MRQPFLTWQKHVRETSLQLQAKRETSLQLQAKSAVSVNEEVKELLLSSARQVPVILYKRGEDLVTLMARAAAHVSPKYVYAEKQFVCPRSGDCFAAVVKDYLDGTCKGSQSEKDGLRTDILLEAANFQKRQGWFETDIAKGAAANKSEFDFWTIASQFEDAKNVAPLAQKLLTCYSAMGDVEITHKHTSRHRTKYSSKKMDSTSQAYCEIAIAESNKRRREDTKLKGNTVMEAFRSRRRAAV